MPHQAGTTPLVSVIIPCYNHSHFLPEAIQSVLSQTYPNVEIVVVDDGSTDDTALVASSFPQVRYVYQPNQGLSASRNTGIRHSQGNMLVFLDADDWLYPDALRTNVQYLLQNPQLAFVSGGYDNVLVEEGIVKEVVRTVETDHYIHLLQSNYIGMIAAVMFRRWVFDEFVYDTALRACEDYDLYFKVARKYPVAHHTRKLTGYRIYSSNMSSNIPRMLDAVMKVLKRQKGELRSSEEKQAYRRGVELWKNYYCYLLYQKMVLHSLYQTRQAVRTLLKYKPKLGIKYILRLQVNYLKSLLV